MTLCPLDLTAGSDWLVVVFKGNGAALPYDLAGIVLIWNVAPGSSADSACTVALIPILASAPLKTPHGNHRN